MHWPLPLPVLSPQTDRFGLRRRHDLGGLPLWLFLADQQLGGGVHVEHNPRRHAKQRGPRAVGVRGTEGRQRGDQRGGHVLHKHRKRAPELRFCTGGAAYRRGCAVRRAVGRRTWGPARLDLLLHENNVHVCQARDQPARHVQQRGKGGVAARTPPEVVREDLAEHEAAEADDSRRVGAHHQGDAKDADAAVHGAHKVRANVNVQLLSARLAGKRLKQAAKDVGQNHAPEVLVARHVQRGDALDDHGHDRLSQDLEEGMGGGGVKGGERGWEIQEGREAEEDSEKRPQESRTHANQPVPAVPSPWYLGASDVLGTEKAAQELGEETIRSRALVQQVAAELYDLAHNRQEKIGKGLLVPRLERRLDHANQRQHMPKRRLDALMAVPVAASA